MISALKFDELVLSEDSSRLRSSKNSAISELLKRSSYIFNSVLYRSALRSIKTTQKRSRCIGEFSLLSLLLQQCQRPVLLHHGKIAPHRLPLPLYRLPTHKSLKTSSINSSLPPIVWIALPSSKHKVQPTPGSSTTSTPVLTPILEAGKEPVAKETSPIAKHSLPS